MPVLVACLYAVPYAVRARRLRSRGRPVPRRAVLAFAGALRSGAVHLLQHLSFVACGVNAWLALLGPLPKPAWFTTPVRLGWIGAWWLLGSGVGAALVFSAAPVYAPYPDVDAQSAAGAL